MFEQTINNFHFKQLSNGLIEITNPKKQSITVTPAQANKIYIEQQAALLRKENTSKINTNNPTTKHINNVLNAYSKKQQFNSMFDSKDNFELYWFDYLNVTLNDGQNCIVKLSSQTLNTRIVFQMTIFSKNRSFADVLSNIAKGIENYYTEDLFIMNVSQLPNYMLNPATVRQEYNKFQAELHRAADKIRELVALLRN